MPICCRRNFYKPYWAMSASKNTYRTGKCWPKHFQAKKKTANVWSNYAKMLRRLVVSWWNITCAWWWASPNAILAGASTSWISFKKGISACCALCRNTIQPAVSVLAPMPPGGSVNLSAATSWKTRVPYASLCTWSNPSVNWWRCSAN